MGSIFTFHGDQRTGTGQNLLKRLSGKYPNWEGGPPPLQKCDFRKIRQKT